MRYIFGAGKVASEMSRPLNGLFRRTFIGKRTTTGCEKTQRTPRDLLRRNGASVLPGGRIIVPLGDQHYITGPGAFGLAVSPSGREIVTANSGPWRTSLTVLERARDRWEVRQVNTSAKSDSIFSDPQPGAADWRSV